MTDRYSDLHTTGPASRSGRLDQVLATLLSQAPELEAAAVVSFDGLPMASALPPGMDEDRVAAMSAALLSLGERAAQGLGRGDLSQVYIEGESGTVFLVSADDEAVLVAVGARGAKVGLLLFEVRRAAAAVADTLRVDEAVVEPQQLVQPAPQPVQAQPVQSQPVQAQQPYPQQVVQPVPQQPQQLQPVPQQQQQQPVSQPQQAPQQQPVSYLPEPREAQETNGNGSSPRNEPAASWS